MRSSSRTIGKTETTSVEPEEVMAEQSPEATADEEEAAAAENAEAPASESPESSEPSASTEVPPALKEDRPESIPDLGAAENGGGDGAGIETGDFDLSRMEREYIRRALDRTGGNRTEAAGLLGISRRTLQRKLKEMSTDANSLKED